MQNCKQAYNRLLILGTLFTIVAATLLSFVFGSEGNANWITPHKRVPASLISDANGSSSANSPGAR